MKQPLPSKMMPALVAGAAFGVASGIPIVNLANCACCALAIGGGLGAAFLWLRNAPAVAEPPYGDGLLLGLITGVIGALTATIVGIPFSLMGSAMGFGGVEQMREMMGDQDIPPALENILGAMGGTGFGIGAAIVSLLLSLVLFSIFAAVGGLIGTALFHKKAAPAL